MISEEQIESTIESISTDNTIFAQDHIYPDLWEYLELETLPQLIEEERPVLVFCVSVVSQSIKDHLQTDFEFDIDEYISAEENNWAKRDKSKRWEESLNEFFAETQEEDLLAFLEDMLVDDEDQKISIAGKEIIFISAKSLVDLIPS